MRIGLLKALTGAILVGGLLGCSSGPSASLNESSGVFKIQTRRLPPEPVYNRVTWAHLPDIVPDRTMPERASGMVIPVVTVNLKNVTLEEASRRIAGSAQYASYCASSLTKQKITFNHLGTLDEIAEALSRQAGIRVVVDHQGRAMRFLPQETEEPRFYDESPQ